MVKLKFALILDSEDWELPISNDESIDLTKSTITEIKEMLINDLLMELSNISNDPRDMADTRKYLEDMGFIEFEEEDVYSQGTIINEFYEEGEED